MVGAVTRKSGRAGVLSWQAGTFSLSLANETEGMRVSVGSIASIGSAVSPLINLEMQHNERSADVASRHLRICQSLTQ